MLQEFLPACADVESNLASFFLLILNDLPSQSNLLLTAENVLLDSDTGLWQVRRHV